MIMDWETARQYLPLLLSGAWMTLLLSGLTLVFGLLIAIPVAVSRNGASLAGRVFAAAFVFVFRGAPILVLLFLIYRGSAEIEALRDGPLWVLFREPLFCAVLALSLNSAGYLSEILAGAARNVPRGEIEAARSMGFRRIDVWRHVFLPHVARISLRAYGNEIVFVIKGTAAASMVTIMDVMASANQIYFNTFDPVTPLVAAGLVYLGFVALVSACVRRLERELSPEIAAATLATVVGRRSAAASGSPA